MFGLDTAPPKVDQTMTLASTFVVLSVSIAAAALIMGTFPEKPVSEQKELVSQTAKKLATYAVKVECSNCRKTYSIEFTMGVKVTIDSACPKCGVKDSLSVLREE